MHKARKIISILNQIAMLTHRISYTVKRLWPERDFCQGQMMHKPRKRELSSLLTAHCLDKIHIFMKFCHHIPYDSEVMAYNNILPRTYNSTVKNQGLSFLFIPHCGYEIYLSEILP